MTIINKLFDFSKLESVQEFIKIAKKQYSDNFDKSSSIIIKDSTKVERVENRVEISNQSMTDLSLELKKKLKEKKKKFYLNPSVFDIVCKPKVINEKQ